MAKSNELYLSALERLKSDIANEKYPFNSRLPSEAVLSKELQICRSTLRKVLNALKSEGYIETRQGSGSYICNRNVSRFIPVILPNRDTVSRITEMLQGIQDGLSDVGFSPLITVRDKDSQDEMNTINEFVKKGHKNIIIVPATSERNSFFYQELLHQGVNLIFVDILPNNINCDYVTSCNFLGGYLVAKKFIDLGHKKIAFCSLSDPKRINTLGERFAGYVSALSQNRIEYSDNLVFIKHGISNEEFAADILNKCSEATAIFSATDELAFILIHKLAGSDRNLAVCGFDNWLVDESMNLASVNQNFYEIGKAAAELLYKRIIEPKKPYEHVYIPVSLIERDSLAPTYY